MSGNQETFGNGQGEVSSFDGGSTLLKHSSHIRVVDEGGGQAAFILRAPESHTDLIRHTIPDLGSSFSLMSPDQDGSRTVMTPLDTLRRLTFDSTYGKGGTEVLFEYLNGIRYARISSRRTPLPNGRPVVATQRLYRDGQTIRGLREATNPEIAGGIGAVMLATSAENSPRRFVLLENLNRHHPILIDRQVTSTDHPYHIADIDVLSNPSPRDDKNFDNSHSNPRQGYGIVADGNGRHPSSEVVAKIAVDTFAQGLSNADLSNLTPYTFHGIIENISMSTVRAIIDQQVPDATNPDKLVGTTLAIAVVRNGMLYHAAIGDPRIYHFSVRSDTLSLQTREEISLLGWLRNYSEGNELWAGAVMDDCLRKMNAARTFQAAVTGLERVFEHYKIPAPVDAGERMTRRYPAYISVGDFWKYKNQITNTFTARPTHQGRENVFGWNIGAFPVFPGDTILMASDAISNLTDQEIEQVLRQNRTAKEINDTLDSLMLARMLKQDDYAPERAHRDENTLLTFLMK